MPTPYLAFEPAHLLESDFHLPAVPIETITLPDAPDASVAVLRLDQLHPWLGGNKAFKLRLHLQQARAAGCTQLLTFGGAWSNHLLATAVAGAALGFETLGLVRGEPTSPLNPLLAIAVKHGMQLVYLSRSDYRAGKTQLQHWRSRYPQAWVIPEGGGGSLGMQGARQIMRLIPADFATVACACGTAATLSGLLLAARPQQHLLGVAVLKGADFLRAEVAALLQSVPASGLSHWELETRFHGRGYARSTPELEHFLRCFSACNAVPLEPVYTGKLFFALNQRLSQGESLPEPILALHTGGVYAWSRGSGGSGSN